MSSAVEQDTAEGRRGRPRDRAKDEAILHAASALFLERGFEAVSVDAVAQAAGVSKATIYARYADKEAMFREVLRAKCESVLAPTEFSPEGAASPRERLEAIARSFLALVMDPEAVAMHRVIVAEGARAPRAAELFYETAVERTKARLSAWLRAETEAGRLKVRDPERAAVRFFGAVKGEAHMRATFGLPPLPADYMDHHVRACAEDFARAHAPD